MIECAIKKFMKLNIDHINLILVEFYEMYFKILIRNSLILRYFIQHVTFSFVREMKTTTYLLKLSRS